MDTESDRNPENTLLVLVISVISMLYPNCPNDMNILQKLLQEQQYTCVLKKTISIIKSKEAILSYLPESSTKMQF